jgi:2-dehydropantoate 2-reductase
MKNIYLIGLGAIGCLFGQKIQISYKDNFKVLADLDRIENYKQNGIFINHEKFDFNFADIKSYSESADLLIFSVKQYQLSQALKDAEKVISGQTVIMSLLNGIESENDIQEKFPDNRIIHSLCIGQDAVRDGNTVNYSKPGKIIFGQLDGNNDTQAIKGIQAIFDASNIQYEISDHITYDMWKKFLINVSINQFSAILNAPYGVFHHNEHAQTLLRMAAQEIVELSSYYNINLRKEEVENFIDIMRTLSPDGLTSMLQDVRAGRKTEYEMMSKTVIKLAEDVGLEVPVNRILYHLMATMDYMTTIRKEV